MNHKFFVKRQGAKILKESAAHKMKLNNPNLTRSRLCFSKPRNCKQTLCFAQIKKIAKTKNREVF